MFAFQRIEVFSHLDRASVETHYIKADSRFDALKHITSRLRYHEHSDMQEFVTFMSGIYETIVKAMNIADPRLELLEAQNGLYYWACKNHERYTLQEPKLSLTDILELGVEVNAITETILAKYIFKGSQSITYKLEEIVFEDA